MQRTQRHLGRELALQWLFQMDLGHQPVEEVLATVPDAGEEWLERRRSLEPEAVDYARALVSGVLADQARIDATIVRFAVDWPLDRMAAVERNVLRIALFELMDESDMPVSVAINEAVEVTKRYAGRESAHFVNGILGAYTRGQDTKPE